MKQIRLRSLFDVVTAKKGTLTKNPAASLRDPAETARSILGRSSLDLKGGSSMKVKDIMTRDPKSCGPRDTLASVVHSMWDRDCGMLPVVDKTDRVIGVITDRDVALAVWRKDRSPSDIRVDQLPLARLYCCAPTDDIDDALRIMRQAQVRRLPIIDEEEKLVGIISMDDLARHARDPGGSKNGLTAQKVSEALKAICAPGKPKHHVAKPTSWARRL
jgi:CBS domain-containing protein